MRTQKINKSGYHSDEYVKLCKEFKDKNSNSSVKNLKPVFGFLMKMVIGCIELPFSEDFLALNYIDSSNLKDESEDKTKSNKKDEKNLNEHDNNTEDVDSDASILDYMLGITKTYSPSRPVISDSESRRSVENDKVSKTWNDDSRPYDEKEDLNVNADNETELDNERIDRLKYYLVNTKEMKKPESKCWILKFFGCCYQ